MARAPHSSVDLSLVVEIATEGLDSKENKELGIKITSECPLDGCPLPLPTLVSSLCTEFSSITNSVFPM